MEKEQEKEKKTNAEDEAAKELIRELGLLSTGAGFDSDLQYISIIGSIEGHSVLPADNKTTPAGRSPYPAAGAPTLPSDRPYPLP